MHNAQIRPTAELDDAALAGTRALCDRAFEEDFSDADWEYALGGVHALGYEDDRLVAHAALVARRLLHADRALGPTAVLTPEGIRPTPDADGAIFVRAAGAALDPEQPLICDWRDGDVW